MTQKDKIRRQFIDNPRSLPLSKILSFLTLEGYELIEGKGSHMKVLHTGSKDHYTLPVHHGELIPPYKDRLKKFYLSHSPAYDAGK